MNEHVTQGLTLSAIMPFCVGYRVVSKRNLQMCPRKLWKMAIEMKHYACMRIPQKNHKSLFADSMHGKEGMWLVTLQNPFDNRNMPLNTISSEMRFLRKMTPVSVRPFMWYFEFFQQTQQERRKSCQLPFIHQFIHKILPTAVRAMFWSYSSVRKPNRMTRLYLKTKNYKLP